MMRSFARSAAVIVGLATAIAGCGDDRALSQQQFSELVRDRVQEQYPGVLISRFDEGGFDYVRGTGEQGRVTVAEEYRYYTQHPESLEELVARVASLVGTRERLSALQGDQARLRRLILPIVKPRTFLAEAEARARGQQLLQGEHQTGLLVFYVLDEPTSISFMTASSLGGLGMSFRQLTQIALTNLAGRVSVDSFVVEPTSSGPIAVANNHDSLDASRLLAPNLRAILSRLLETSGALVVAIPRRDLLLAAAASEPALVERLRDRAAREHAAGPYAITTSLFRLDRDGVSTFEAPEDEPDRVAAAGATNAP